MHRPHEFKFGSIAGLKMMAILVLGLILPPGGKAFKYLICIGSCTGILWMVFMCRAMSDRSFQRLRQSSEPRNVSGNEACGPNQEPITCCFAPQPGLCSKRLITVISAAAWGSACVCPEATVCDSATHRCRPLHQPRQAASRLAASSLGAAGLSPLQAE